MLIGMTVLKVVPDVGLELTTDRLQGGCSTTELIRQYQKDTQQTYTLNSNL